jgi:hypothetical protein
MRKISYLVTQFLRAEGGELVRQPIVTCAGPITAIVRAGRMVERHGGAIVLALVTDQDTGQYHGGQILARIGALPPYLG